MVAASQVTLPSAATAAPVEALQICQDIVGSPPQPKNLATLGECTSFFRPFDLESDGLPTLVCRFWLESGQLEDFGYDTFQECVIGEQEFFNE
jgi:hypothetical protein